MADFNANEPLVEAFLFETSQLLEQLEKAILSSEEDHYYSEENINKIFRIMHTIKGAAAMMMYNDISELTHTIEDLFFYIREENPEQDFCTTLNDLIFDSIDFIKIELEKIRNRDHVDGIATELINRLKTFLEELKERGEDPSHGKQQKEKISLFKAVIFFEEGCEMENIRAYSVIHNMKKLAKELIYFPQDILDNDETVEAIRRNGFQIYIKTTLSQDEVYEHLMQTVFLRELEFAALEEEAYLEALVEGIKADPVEVPTQVSQEIKDHVTLEKDKENIALEKEHSIHLQGEVNKAKETKKRALEGEQRQNTPESQGASSAQSIISVSVAKLDKLMDLVGELVIAEAMVLQNPDLEGLELNNFQKAARQLSKITSEIQDTVMSVRMVPLSATFQRMNRIVRDMGKKLNKALHLEIIGEETEVDKNIIERITDPLMHLVRNAIDHGIESAEEREAIGKSSRGVITLEAKNAGGDVHIIVKDDGRGLDREKILKKARDNHLFTTNEADLSDAEVYKMILLPGFSTNENVTEYSGRGVGMDVVAKNIESIGGSLSIDSEKHKGTQITLKLPLTLAIIDGMNLQVGKSTFTIPTISIKESFRPQGREIIRDPDGNEMIMVRGQCYPIVRLHEKFKINTEVTDLSEGIITMVSQDEHTVCIFADRLLGQQQVVVKSLPEYIKKFRRIKGISGCTLLGDGSISLILDIVNLVNTR